MAGASALERHKARAEGRGLMALQDAAARLDVSRWTVDRWLKARGARVRRFAGDPRGYVEARVVEAIEAEGVVLGREVGK